jgi:glucosylceramidase
VTLQNEPTAGTIPDFPFNCMGWNATSQTEYASKYLGPTLEAAGYGDVKIMALDDQRPLAPKWANEVLVNAFKLPSGSIYTFYRFFLTLWPTFTLME